MKKILLFIITFTGFWSARAQDYIYATSGELIVASVSEVNTKEIVYKKYNNPNGPQYRMPLTEIVLIEYQNGTIEKFTVLEYDEIPPVDTVSGRWGKNLIGVNLLNIWFSNAHVWYERILNPGFGIRLSVNVHTGPLKDNEFGDPVWATYTFTSGADLNFYPGRQGKIRYYFGPGFRMGTVREKNLADPNGRKDFIYNYRAIFINNGINLQATRHLFIGAQLGLGLQRILLLQANAGNPDWAERFTDLEGMMMFNVGWRF